MKSKSTSVLFSDKFIAFLSNIPEISHPDLSYEQYTTPTEIIQQFYSFFANKITGSQICDLGCGTGKLCIPLSMFNPKLVLGIDIDSKSLITAQEFLDANKITKIHLICSPIEFCPVNTLRNAFDFVIANPPFGTKRKGIDSTFVQKGMILANEVFSIHLMTKDLLPFFKKWSKQQKIHVEILKVIDLSLSKSLPFHRYSVKRIPVAFLHFTR